MRSSMRNACRKTSLQNSAEFRESRQQCQLGIESALRTDAKVIADEQHADHQLRIDRWPSRVTVEASQFSANLRQVDKTVDGAQHMICRDVAFKGQLVN